MTEAPRQTPQAPARRTSQVAIFAMLVLGGLVLAVGGCGLFLTNFSSSNAKGLAQIGMILFGAGCLAFVVGSVWAIVFLVVRVIRSRKAR